MSSIPRVAIVHDWLTGMRGGESVLEAIVELFPQAELFTLIADPSRISETLRRPKLHTSFLQKIPGAIENYRKFLPLMPAAISQMDLSEFDLILSSSHCVAKGVKKRNDAVHISYIHAPMRYMWDRFDDYFGPGKAGLPVRMAARACQPWLRVWDRSVSQVDRVDHLIANSQFIAGKISEFYGRQAEVIYPFVGYERFQKLSRNPKPYYLVLSAFAPYKRIDLAIEAFNQLRLPLKIVGDGQDEAKLREMAGPTIEFLGKVNHEQAAQLYSECQALIFPGLEDFGITPLEAMASGAPVIAFGQGGATETVTAETGVFFYEQSVHALCEAVMKLESAPKSAEACRARASEFTKARFQEQFMRAVQKFER